MKQTLRTGPFRRLFPSLVLSWMHVGVLLFCGASIFAFFFFSSSPASAALFATLTPTEENHWAFVSVLKPTYTPAPVLTSVPTTIPSTALPIATEAAGVMDMQVLSNTAAPA